VKGTKFGTNTDFDGKYAIKATPSQILTFSWDGLINGSFFIICKYYNDADAFELEGVASDCFRY
jgi:hypothetical protein